MGRNQSVEALRNWRELYKSAWFETDASKLPRASKRPSEHWSFDPENCLKLLPVTTAKWRLSRMHSMLSTPWRTP